MDQRKIGKFIQELRKKKGFTQEELALRLNVSSKSISRWENGKNMPDLSLLIPISRELGITVNELISGEIIKAENYQERLEQTVINTAIVLKKQAYKFILKIISIILIINMSIIIGIGLFLLINKYQQKPIYLKQNELNIKICEWDEDYYGIFMKVKDKMGAHNRIKKDFDTKTVNLQVYRTKIEMKNIKLLEEIGLGTILIEKNIENIYYDNHLIWDISMKVEKCN